MDNNETKPYDPELPSSHSPYGAPRPLNLRRKIFLSHSGKDKNFVRFLHKELCLRYHDERLIFFDERDLPTAEPINMTNILIEARGCELGVLVLSEDFFTHTANPMLELEVLTANKVRLLPLFYKISVDEFKKKRDQTVWETRWKEWSVVNNGNIMVWRDALEIVSTYSGLEYCKQAVNELEYICKIVNKITGTVRPAIAFTEEGVCGRDRLCEIVNNMYTNCASMRSSDGCSQVLSRCASNVHEEDSGDTLDLVGIYGFAGLGKSTLCKCLCDFYFAKFHGKVCWIDLGSTPLDQRSSQEYSSCAYIKRMQHVLSMLVGSIDDVYSLTISQVENLLKRQISYMMDPIFLAIDNILPCQESLEEASFYLRCKFPKGSKIFITSRNKKILESITSEFTKLSVVIEYIPKLIFEEAMGIFVHKFSNLQNLGAEAEVNECVRLCIVNQHDGMYASQHNGYWFHPLMLISLAASLKDDERLGIDWKSKVRELQSGAIVDETDAWKRVFNILDITYVALSDKEQKVFLDLALFYMMSAKSSTSGHEAHERSYAWIQAIYSHLGNKQVDKILLKLVDLSFINWERKDTFFIVHMHDLMMDFSKYKLWQGAASVNLHCLLLEDDAHWQKNPTFRFLLADAMSAGKWPLCPPKNVRTVSISGCHRSKKLDLRNLEGLQLLHLVDNPGLQEVLLSPTTIASVCSFIVKVPDDTTSSLRCIMDEGWSTPSSTASEGQLVWMELEGDIILINHRKKGSWWSHFRSSDISSTEASMFDIGFWPCLWNLEYLSLSHIPLIQSIGLTTITRLKTLTLESLPRLRKIHGLEGLTNLEKLSIVKCNELVVLTIPANLRLFSEIKRCGSLQTVSLHYTMTYPEADCDYGELKIYGCPALRGVHGIAEYMGTFRFFISSSEERCQERCLQEEIRELLGSSKFMATATQLVLRGHSLKGLCVQDVQHAGFLVSALNMPKATGLECLKIICRKDGDCGCNKNVPRFGPRPGSEVSGTLTYQCRQVRDLSSLTQLGHWISTLNLGGCCSVEVWPDFATMRSLTQLWLSHTSLKKLPAQLLLLPSLYWLKIEGCSQLPVEEIIKAITSKDLGYNCECGGCLGYNCGCGIGSLQSLLDDLRNNRRDRGSVVDVLDSEWPHLVALLHKQRQKFKDKVGGAQLQSLIFVMYELWFGEVEASDGGSDTEGHPSPIKKRMKRLLCNETFMSLVFNSEAKLNLAYFESGMAIALIGSASIGCINASLNEDLKDRIVNFVQYVIVESSQKLFRKRSNYHLIVMNYYKDLCNDLQVQVPEVVREMVKALSELDVKVDYSTSPWFINEREKEREREGAIFEGRLLT